MAWHLFVYRLPKQSSSMRVAVWRELRRIGALPLQQAVVALPEAGGMSDKLDSIGDRVRSQGGTVYRFPLHALSEEDDARLTDEWNALRTQEYEEIVEECETKFEREIEFEVFRENFTAAEAEEIEADLEKIKAWFERVCARDVFVVRGRERAEQAIARCERLLDDFVQRVYDAETEHGPSLEPPTPIDWPHGAAETAGDRGEP
ncbi:MAG: Chromate resistance protein ChrB [Solirubrobacteraceae bacterium]